MRIAPFLLTKVELSRQRHIVALLCSVFATLATFCPHSLNALPSRDQSILQNGRWVIDMGLKSSNGSPMAMMRMANFIGLDSYADLYWGQRQRGSVVFQLFGFDQRQLSLTGESSPQSSFAFFPCVIAPELWLLPQGRLSLKVGHIWPSYGLRDEVNTTQTLRQLISARNVGLFIDWGASLGGVRRGVSYSVSLTRGSGAWPSFDKERYLLAARLGLNEDSTFGQDTNLKIGFSALSARLALAQGFTQRWRAGVDARYDGPISLLIESSLGGDQQTDTQDPSSSQSRTVARNTIIELSWSSPLEAWYLYTQYRYLSDASAGFTKSALMTSGEVLSSLPVGVQQSLTLGALYQPIAQLFIGAELVQALSEAPLAINAQVRYRW